MPVIVSCVGRIYPSLLKFMHKQLTFHAKNGSSDSFVESEVQSKMIYWKQRLSWLLTRRISIPTIFRSDPLLKTQYSVLKNFSNEHIQLFGSQESDSCVVSNFGFKRYSSKVELIGATMNDRVAMSLSCSGYDRHPRGSSLLLKYSTFNLLITDRVVCKQCIYLQYQYVQCYCW